MSQSMIQLLPLLLLIFIMYFLLIRPQKKREKAVNAMRNAVKVGDEIVTIGGICGKIVKTKDETLTIQVGADKTKFEIMRWAVSKVVSEEPASKAKRTTAEETEESPEEKKKALPKKMKNLSPEKEAAPAEPVVEVTPPVETAEAVQTPDVVEDAAATEEK